MNGGLIIAALLVLGSVACGFTGRFGRFALVLAVALVANQIWMMTALNARVAEPHLILAQVGAVFYAIGALGFGWLAGRVARLWRASRVVD